MITSIIKKPKVISLIFFCTFSDIFHRMACHDKASIVSVFVLAHESFVASAESEKVFFSLTCSASLWNCCDAEQCGMWRSTFGSRCFCFTLLSDFTEKFLQFDDDAPPHTTLLCFFFPWVHFFPRLPQRWKCLTYMHLAPKFCHPLLKQQYFFHSSSVNLHFILGITWHKYKMSLPRPWAEVRESEVNNRKSELKTRVMLGTPLSVFLPDSNSCIKRTVLSVIDQIWTYTIAWRNIKIQDIFLFSSPTPVRKVRGLLSRQLHEKTRHILN